MQELSIAPGGSLVIVSHIERAGDLKTSAAHQALSVLRSVDETKVTMQSLSGSYPFVAVLEGGAEALNRAVPGSNLTFLHDLPVALSERGEAELVRTMFRSYFEALGQIANSKMCSRSDPYTFIFAFFEKDARYSHGLQEFLSLAAANNSIPENVRLVIVSNTPPNQWSSITPFTSYTHWIDLKDSG